MKYRRRKKKDDSCTGLAVKVYNNNVDGALRKFKKMIKESKLMVELKERQYYTKPSEKRREKANKIKSRIKYQNLKN